MFKQIKEFPNHFIDNDVVIRGERQKTIIKPNEYGLYKIRCKGEETWKSIDELKNPFTPSEDPVEEKKRRDKDTHRISKRCSQNGTTIGAYRAFLEASSLPTLEELTLEQNYANVDAWRKGRAPDEPFKIKDLCDEVGVCSKAYSMWSSSKGKKPLQLTKKENIENIRAYKNHRDQKGVEETLVDKSYRLGVGFAAFKSWAIRKGLYKNKTHYGKLVLMDMYLEQIKKREKENIKPICELYSVDFEKYKRWVYSKGFSIKGYDREWHLLKIQEYKDIRRVK